MVNQDRARQERLLKFAGWLHHKHRFQTPVYGSPYTEVRFTRENLGNIPALEAYGIDRGDAGEQALYRDVNALASFGIDVRWDPADQSWVSRVSPLTDAECRALTVAALSVIVEDGSSTPGGYHLPGAGISAEGAELIVAYAPMIDVLVEAIRERKTVDITHRGRVRAVDPWHVFMADGRWYLVGHDHDADDERVFAIDAIDTVNVSAPNGGYRIPKRDFAAIGRRVVDPDEWTSTEPLDVRLDVDPRLATRAEELLGAVPEDSAPTRGWVPMRCTVRNVDAFIDRLWSLRARAVVTAPPEIRERVVTTLEEML